MAGLSISKAWEEGAGFAAREFRLLFPIAFLLTVVPQLVLNLFIPAEQSVEMAEFAQFVQRNGIGLFVAIAVVVFIVVLTLQTLGSLAISYLALRPGTSVGESFAVATRRLPAVMTAIMLIGLVFGLLVTPVFLLMPADSELATGSVAAGTVGLALLLLVIMLVVMAVLFTKLLPLLPAGAVEPIGPIALIRRSWSLTKGHFWPLLGTILLIGLVYSIALSLLGMVIGLLVLATLGSPFPTPFDPIPNATATFIYNLILSLIGCVVSIFLLCFFARIYAHLSGRTQEVGQVFE